MNITAQVTFKLVYVKVKNQIKVSCKAFIDSPKYPKSDIDWINILFPLGMNRRAALEPICTHSWKWFDVGSGKWCTYAQPNNKTIDDAFWAGDSNVRIQHSRKKYVITFGTMMQVRNLFVCFLLTYHRLANRSLFPTSM